MFKGRKTYCGGQTIKTSPSQVHDDLPWDAYLLNKDGSIRYWADGWDESEALMNLIKKIVESAGFV